MGQPLEGVRTKPLKWRADDRGRLIEILRNDDALFKGFGQVYLTTCKPGVVKAWHYHELQDDSFFCIAGRLRVGLYDARAGSPTRGQTAEFIMTPDEPYVLQIPRGVMHGFEALGEEEAVVLNTPNMAYNHKDPDELRVDPFQNDIPFKWHAKRGA